MTVKEVTIRVKDAQKKKHQHTHLSYDDFVLSEHDPIVQGYLKELTDSIKEKLEEPEFTVTVKMVIS